jgi:hypothetical protein
MPPPRPDPLRDRQLAAQVRLGPRIAQPLGSVIDSWLQSPAARRGRRFGEVVAALDRLLEPAHRHRVRPLRWTGGTLTLEVDDAPLLAEFRQFRHDDLIEELVAHRTGITRIIYRLGPAPAGDR